MDRKAEGATRWHLSRQSSVLDMLDKMISSRVTGPIMKCADHFSISHSLVAKWSKAHHRGKLKQHLSSLKSPGHGKRVDSKAAKKNAHASRSKGPLP